MTTPKALRAAPTQVFEKYTLTRQVGPGQGLYPISSLSMKRIKGPAGSEGAVGKISDTIFLGFVMKFNEKFYDKFVLGTSGWIILREIGDIATFDAKEYNVIEDKFFTENWSIKPKITTGGILLCPWFDKLRNAYTSVAAIPSYLQEGSKINLIRGKIVPSIALDPIDSGILYANITDPQEGRATIVRWRSLTNSDNTKASTVVTFDVVIYESGKIEFRYDARDSFINEKGASILSDATLEGATIGIFINDNSDDVGGWRFRDFSKGLGHPNDYQRTPSEYGGFVYETAYQDNGCYLDGADYVNRQAPYNFTLFATDVDEGTVLGSPPSTNEAKYRMINAKANWPGQDRFGCVMTFSPPTNHRRILPRLEVKKQDIRQSYPQSARTGDSRLGKFLSPYDDRRALMYATGSVLNFPVMLPRDYASTEAGSYVRRDLYGDFYATGSVTQFATDVFLGEKPIERISPFSDHDRPEQAANHKSNEFFVTGSPVGKFGFALSQGLRSKTQIKMDLPINHQLQMFPTSSAIYYYNKNSKGFFVPQIGNARNDIMDAKAALGTPDGTNLGLYRPEDARGFGPIGNQVASGSFSGPMTLDWASDSDFDQTILGGEIAYAWQASNRTRLLSKKYDKSLPNNPDYVSLQDETFVLPINAPFLLEKAVFEIPLKAGPGWLNDKTKSSTPIGFNPYVGKNFGISFLASDFAGPAITVSLFNQINSGSTAFKDLIMTGTIISSNDNIKNVSLKNSWTNYFGCEFADSDLYPLSILEPEGFLSYGTPAAVINPDGDYFTGSIGVKMESSISNGPLVSFYAYSNFYLAGFQPPAGTYNQQAIDLVTAPYIDVKAKYQFGTVQNSILKTVDVFGRNSKGFEVSGRSLFGNEFLVSQNQNGGIPNPLYVADSYDNLPTSFKDLLSPTINPDFRFFTNVVVPITNTTSSPYLLMPGDKLTLALSKMRPALASNGYDPISGLQTLDIFNDGLEHDVWVNTGSIKVTFYGSLLREGAEYHDTLNQNLDTDIVHDVIGGDAVLDQYDVEYSYSLSGSYVDDYVTGSLVSLVDRNLVTGLRGRVFSRLNAASAGFPQDVISRSDSLQPWTEKVGQFRFLNLLNEEERLYDSMTPNISEILSLNEKSIGYSELESITAGKNVGVLYFNDSNGNPILVDDIWHRNFPFSPIYAGLSRQLISNMQLRTSIDTNGNNIPEKKIDILVMSFGQGIYFKDAPINDNEEILNLSDTDVSKLFFGFGEVSNGSWNNIPGHREKQGSVYKIGPIIRGWKYGLCSGTPAYSSVVFRRDRYGQFRDMLEQRINTVFRFKRIVYGRGANFVDRTLITNPPVTVKFINPLASGNPITDPSLTLSQNLSPHVTSSLPYFDGEARNRGDLPGDLRNQEDTLVFVG